MTELEKLKQEIDKLKERNKSKDANKAWETSLSRKVILLITTYFVVGLTLITIKNPRPWINAVIPSLGFFLSTLSLPFVKKYWVEHIYKK